MTHIAINGMGRIGRLTLRRLLDRPDLKIVAINDLTDPATLTHLLRYDSVQGPLAGISLEGNELVAGEQRIALYSEKDPRMLPWEKHQVDVVVECTGAFRNREKMAYHLEAGARKVLLSAPAKGGDPVKTIVSGVNDQQLTADDQLVSNASCTTNCLAPMAAVLDQAFGIERGFMTTTHAYTGDQNLQDAPHRDLRRARAAALSIIPTTTGAAEAVGLVLPRLAGKLTGFAMRVPVPTGSVTDLSVVLEQSASAEAVNEALRNAAKGPLQGIMEYSEAPIVSADIVGNDHSCILDAPLTLVNGRMAKIVGWYDNEAGYAARLAEIAEKMARL